MQDFIKKQLVWILLVTIFLSGCCTTNEPTLIWRNYSCYDYYEMLIKRGVKIIRVGESYQIVISSDDIFYPHSANFNSDAMSILGPLVGYLRCYETTYMQITGHTDNLGSLGRNIALSKRQAERVEKYLSMSWIDARIMLAIGRGPYVPIADNSIPSHSEQNRRIEIRFRKVVVPPLV